MKYTNHEELSNYIFSVYLLHGKFPVHDKSMYEAFDFGVKTVEELKDFVRLIVEAMDNAHEHLDDTDYIFAAVSSRTPSLEQMLWEMDDDQYVEQYAAIVDEICEDKEELALRMTEL